MKVQDGPTRLACYDAEMRRIAGAADSAPPQAASAPESHEPAAPPEPASRPQPALTPRPALTAEPARAPETAPATSSAASAGASQDPFGLPPGARAPRMPSRVTAGIASAVRQSSGRYLITLENGQVWLQTEDQLGFNPHRGSSVSIKRGLTGAYWMSDKYYVVGVRRLR